MTGDKSGLFIYAWRALAPDSAQDAIEWTAEYQFHEVRKWRFDWSLPERKIAVEVDGGNDMVKWSEKAQRHVAVGAHTKATDYDKLNHAAASGWRVFRFSTKQLENDPSACIALVLKGLGFEAVDEDYQPSTAPITCKVKARIGKRTVSTGFVYEGDSDE